MNLFTPRQLGICAGGLQGVLSWASSLPQEQVGCSFTKPSFAG